MINTAYIDGQNLYMGTTHATLPWQVNYTKFYRYLKDKYNVQTAYYFVGDHQPDQVKLYTNLQKAGFIVTFRMHNENMVSHKKGNVDTDVVFSIMRDLYEGVFNDGKAILVSGDGDYIRIVKYLAGIDKLERVIFPNRANASSLYSSLDNKYKTPLDNPAVKHQIRHAI